MSNITNYYPLISIIIPVYNVEKYLRRCLDSILSQTYNNFEVILVDDGSQDSSGQICDQYSMKDKRFHVIHKQNAGVSKARISAFERSKGELITFIDSDDYVDENYLKKLALPIIENDADMVSCNIYTVYNNSIHEGSDKMVGWFDRNRIVDILKEQYFYSKGVKGYAFTIYLCTKMMKRIYVIDALEAGKNLWYGEDQVGVYAVLQKINLFCSIPDRLYFYVQYDQQTTKLYKPELWNAIIDLQKRYIELDKDHLSTRGINKRTIFHIYNTIFNKMSRCHMDYDVFRDELKKVFENSFLKAYFEHVYISGGIKINVKYWLIKFKLYFILYLFYKNHK